MLKLLFVSLLLFGKDTEFENICPCDDVDEYMEYAEFMEFKPSTTTTTTRKVLKPLKVSPHLKLRPKQKAKRRTR